MNDAEQTTDVGTPEIRVDETVQQIPKEPRKRLSILTLLLLLLGTIIVLICAGIWLMGAPSSFQEETTFVVQQGASASSIAASAKEEGLVRSELFFYIALLLTTDPSDIHAGTYYFEAPVSTLAFAAKLSLKDTQLELIRVTFPEGIRARDMAELVSSVSPVITAEDYFETALPYEGRLFPETYLIQPEMTTEAFVDLQKETAETVLREVLSDTSTELAEEEVLILASIIEREANSRESMKMVSGIFRNRLAIGMPLQADATIEYELETPLHELPPGALAEALREVDSPYNTYLYGGLPPTPIGNPGRMAIEAAVSPTQSTFLYYITGNDGEFYYAETLAEHNANIARYLSQ